MDPVFFFDGFDRLARIAILAPLLYVFAIALIRAGGKRTTSQMNNFDWVVTVALGSLAASGILFPNIPLADVVLAMAIMVGLKWLTTKTALHLPFMAHAVKARPAVLFAQGRHIPEAMRRERVLREEVDAAIRAAGHADLGEVAWVILESDATLNVVAQAHVFGPVTAFDDVPLPGRSKP